MEFITHSEKDTDALAKKIAHKVKGGDVIALYGDLGSGKTTFTRFLADALGIKRNITSPTFVVMKEYDLPNPVNDITRLIHLDCYRFQNSDDSESVGLNEMIGQKDTLLVIEWPEIVSNLLPDDVIKMKFEYLNENERKISYE